MVFVAPALVVVVVGVVVAPVGAEGRGHPRHCRRGGYSDHSGQPGPLPLVLLPRSQVDFEVTSGWWSWLLPERVSVFR